MYFKGEPRQAPWRPRGPAQACLDLLLHLECAVLPRFSKAYTNSPDADRVGQVFLEQQNTCIERTASTQGSNGWG